MSTKSLVRSLRASLVFVYLLNLAVIINWALCNPVSLNALGMGSMTSAVTYATAMLVIAMKGPTFLVQFLDNSRFAFLFTFRGRYCMDLSVPLFLYGMHIYGILMSIATLGLVLGIRFALSCALLSEESSRRLDVSMEELSRSLDVSIEELDGILVEAIKELQVPGKSSSARAQSKSKSTTMPNMPACDACGDDFSGKMKCTACECAYYCSRKCQRMAWKKLGHKQECSTMKKKAQYVARKVVKGLADTSGENLTPIDRVQLLMHNLDASGPYMYAVEYGLHKAIRECFTEDAKFIVQNNSHPRGEYHCCFTHWIMMSLFRGQRTSRANSSFNRVDGGRIQAYVQAFPDDGNGFEIWWTASLQAVRLILEPVFEGEGLIKNCQTARDIWSGFALVFASTRASKAILLTHDPARCRERVEWMLTELQKMLARLWVVTGKRDRNGTIEGNLNKVSAMIVAQCRILGNVDIDAPKLLKLKRLKLLMYKRVAVPLAEGAIRKKK